MTLFERLRDYFGSRDRGWLLTLLIGTMALYAPYLANPVFFDDLNLFFNKSVQEYGNEYFSAKFRWLPYATVIWTERWTGTGAPHLLRLENLLIHVANVLLLFGLLRMLARQVYPDRPAVAAWGAWAGALVFALHPVTVYGVGYIAQRTILMATTFALLTQLAFLRGILSGRVAWLVLSVFAYILAVYSKEHSVLTPFLLAAEAILLRGAIRASSLQIVGTGIAYSMVALAIVMQVKGVIGVAYEPSMVEGGGLSANTVGKSGFTLHLVSILTQAGMFFKYLLLWLIPDPSWMSIDMREPLVNGLGDLLGWLSAAAFIAYGVFAVRLLLRGRAKGLLGLALLYPWLQFILEFASIRQQEIFVLYRSYLWMPGLLLVFPYLAGRILPAAAQTTSGNWRGKSILLATLGLAGLLACAATNRLETMSDGVRLWDDAVRLLPSDRVAGADRIYFNRGQAYMEKKRHGDAAADFRHVVAISPQLSVPYVELGMALVELARSQDVESRHEDAASGYREAEAAFSKAIALSPDHAIAHYGKGMSLLGQHKSGEAALYFEKGCRLGYWGACMLMSGIKKDK